MPSKIYSEEAVLIDKSIFGEFGIFRFELDNIPQSAIPGQFVMLKVDLSPYPLLARPFSIFYAEGKELLLLIKKVGITTRYIFKMHEGERVIINGPLGNGFPEKFKDEVILLGGGSGIAPLNFYARKYGFKRFLAGFKTEVQGLFSILPEGIEITTEDGSYGKKGFPTDYIEKSDDVVFSCGPIPMLKSLEGVLNGDIDRVYVSLESMMGCGTGLCAGCGVKQRGKDGYLRVCTQGPVFLFSRIAI